MQSQPSQPNAQNLAQAKEYYRQGEAYFQARQYQDAINYFAAADKLVPAPALDFNIAVAYEYLGQPQSALYYYQRFVQRAPQSPRRSEADAAISRLSAPSTTTPYDQPSTTPSDEPSTNPMGTPTGQPSGGDVYYEPRSEAQPAPSYNRGLVRSDDIISGQTRPGRALVRTEDILRGNGPSAKAPRPVRSRYPGYYSSSRSESDDLVESRDIASGQYRSSYVPAANYDGGSSQTPVYKKWWFWAVIGAAAVVTYSILDDDQPRGQSGTGLGISF